MLYLTGVINYTNHAAALAVFQCTKESDGIVALRLCRDGSAVLSYLADAPQQQDQQPFDIGGCMLNIIRG